MVGASGEAFVAFQRAWFAKIVPSGFVTGHWSADWPGGGRSLGEQVAIFEELARADAPRLGLHFLSLYHAAMTLQEWGTEYQKAKHLPEILNGAVWCQGFSEPGAGSDLAALSATAVREGDAYIVNGQKIWSTMGAHADWCMLLVRTSRDGPKQAGITYLLLDMTSPGVEVRPIRQISGDEEFAEIFLDNVSIPIVNRVGDEGQGWAVAQTTLSAERGLTLVEFVERMSGSAGRLLGTAVGESKDSALFQRFAETMIRLRALRALVARLMERRMAGNERDGDASVAKQFYAAVLRDFTELGLRARGLEGQVSDPFARGAGQETGNWMFDFLNSYMWTIAGGTNEIQRNIIAERVLRLPRELAASTRA